MLEGLYSAAAGLTAQSEQLNAIGNDIANVSTSGYQAERMAFADLLYNPVDEAGTETTVGAGARAQVIGRSETQGSIVPTNDPLDVAIEGQGYLQVSLPGGGTALTRNGALQIDAEGSLTDSFGNRVQPPVKIPAGISESDLAIASDGTVSAGDRTLGRIELVTVPAPGHLLDVGDGLLASNAASGEPRAAAAHLQQGALEQSNVDLGREMALMATTERAFQLDSSAIQTESQMMSFANELRT